MVYIPFISGRSLLGRRKGGGGGGKGGGGGGGKTSTGGSSSGSTSSGSTSSGSSGTRGNPVSVGGSSKSTSVGGNGGGSISTIPSGQPFAGRQMGGGTRQQVYGTPFYGSGYYYPGATGRYVAGRGFPFFFWPLVWGTTAGLGAGYLWASIAEFGSPSNGTRPGGAEVQLRIDSPAPTNTYYLIADTNTATALIAPLTSSCNSIVNKPLAVAPFDGSGDQPKPESAVQYYRSSSVALTMQGYNNTAAFSDDESLPASPLPSHDATFLACLNTTIGAQVPLVDASIAVQTHAFWMLCIALLVGFRNAL